MDTAFLKTHNEQIKFNGAREKDLMHEGWEKSW